MTTTNPFSSYTDESDDIYSVTAYDGADSKNGGAGSTDSKNGSYSFTPGIGSGATFSGSNGIDLIDYSAFSSSDVEVSANVFSDSKSGVTSTRWDVGFSNSDSKGNVIYGTDRLTDVERLKFSDKHLALDLDIDDNAGEVLALLYAGFDALPDAITFGQWIHEADTLDPSGSSNNRTALAQSMLNTYAPTVSDEDLVNVLYSNIVGVPPTAAEMQPFIEMLANGAYTQASLFAMAAAEDLNQSQYATITSTGLAYQPPVDSKLG